MMRWFSPSTCLMVVLAATIGCGEPGNFEPAFHLNNQGLNSARFVEGGGDTPEEAAEIQFNEQARQYIADALEAMFGTPDRPFVFRESGLDLRKIRLASGPAGGLPKSVQDADLSQLNREAAKLKLQQPGLDAEVKKADAEILSHLTKFATDKGIANVKTPADLKDQEQNFRDAYKAAFEAKSAVDKQLAELTGALADINLQIGSYGVAQKGLYRQHCAHCHGTSGDGAGPTAAFLIPYPRDYRQGIFKFKSNQLASRPTTDDLHRVLMEGINDTAMPSFALLPADEVAALVEYVRYLAIRGEVEGYLRAIWLDDRSEMQPSRTELVKKALEPVVKGVSDDTGWVNADKTVIIPAEPYQRDADQTAWLKAGADLFMGDKAKCFSCHGTTGLGDGRKVSEPVYDIWNKDKAKTATDLANARTKLDADTEMTDDDRAKLEAEITRLTNILASYQLPVQAQKPRNLRAGKYRFGRRPLDLFRRVHTGIAGTEMPGAGAAPGVKAPLSEKEIWQIVDFVMSLPYELETHPPTTGTGDAHHAVHVPVKSEEPAGG